MTAQGDILSRRGAEVLPKFGFLVEDREDYALENNSNKQEDLRITHPVVGPTDWTCLIEVKGFTKGAKVNVLQQISKAAGIYQGANKRPASALWCVVNHHLSEPPQARPEPLVSNPEEVQAFADEGGLVLDTRWLFQLEKQLEVEHITADEAADAFLRFPNQACWTRVNHIASGAVCSNPLTRLPCMSGRTADRARYSSVRFLWQHGLCA